MIRLTRLNRAPMVLNSDLIEHIDVTPDTVITLTTGQILRVRESAEEVIERIIGFRRQIFGPEGPHLIGAGEDLDVEVIGRPGEIPPEDARPEEDARE
jgi:flagellar protein FlbD